MRLKGGGLVLIVKIILARYFIVHTPSFTHCVVVVVFILPPLPPTLWGQSVREKEIFLR